MNCWHPGFTSQQPFSWVIFFRAEKGAGTLFNVGNFMLSNYPMLQLPYDTEVGDTARKKKNPAQKYFF